MSDDGLDLSDARAKRTLGPEQYARFQQMKFLRMVFERPGFEDVLRGAVIKFLRKTSDPQLREVADFIEREKVNVADAFSESGPFADAAGVHPGGTPGG